MNFRLLNLSSLALATALVAAPALAEPAAPVEQAALAGLAAMDLGPSESQLDRFELLDLSVAKGWAAYRVIGHGTYADERGPRTSVKCQYPGMKKHPRSGVVLRSWNLGAGKPGDAWTVYAIAEKAAECSSQETSEKNLTAAKAAIAALGLDFARKPALVRPRKNRLRLTVGDQRAVVRIHVKSVPAGEEGEMKGQTVVRLTLGKRVLYSARQEYSTMGAARCTLRVLGAVVEGKQVVFVLSVTTGDMRLEPTTRLGFTKPISLAD